MIWNVLIILDYWKESINTIFIRLNFVYVDAENLNKYM
jgi:hypothetical protein